MTVSGLLTRRGTNHLYTTYLNFDHVSAPIVAAPLSTRKPTTIARMASVCYFQPSSLKPVQYTTLLLLLFRHIRRLTCTLFPRRCLFTIRRRAKCTRSVVHFLRNKRIVRVMYLYPSVEIRNNCILNFGRRLQTRNTKRQGRCLRVYEYVGDLCSTRDFPIGDLSQSNRIMGPRSGEDGFISTQCPIRDRAKITTIETRRARRQRVLDTFNEFSCYRFKYRSYGLLRVKTRFL